MTEETRRHGSEDVEELRAVFSVITDFLKELFPQIKEIINTFVGSLDGAKLGREAGEFYKGLVDAGMDPTKATELTEEFVRKKLSVLDVVKMLPSMIPKKRVEKEIIRRRGEEASCDEAKVEN